MNWSSIAILVIAIVVAVLGIIFFAFVNKNKKLTNYYALFRIGIVWVIFGIIMAVNGQN